MKKTCMMVLMLIPLIPALFAAVRGSVLWLLAAVALIYILAARLPFCRKRECLWVFVLAVPACIPVNLRIFFEFHYALIADYPSWICVMAAIQDITAMLGVETIVRKACIPAVNYKFNEKKAVKCYIKTVNKRQQVL